MNRYGHMAYGSGKYGNTGGKFGQEHGRVPAFRFTVKTDNTGTSNNDQFTLPLTGAGINCVVNWGDGSAPEVVTGTVTHTFLDGAGTKNVYIIGTLKGWRFANLGDKEKITVISEWGVFDLSENQAFRGCANMDITAIDAPAISTLDLSLTFLGVPLTNIGDVPAWPTGSVTNFGTFISNNATFNQDLGPLDVSSGILGNRLLNFSTAFDQDISSWVIANFTTFDQSLSGATLSTSNLDALLVGWQGQAHQSNVPLDLGDGKFSRGARYVSSTTDGATTPNKLIDSSQDFSAGGLNIQVGDAIWNTISGDWARVTAVDNATTLSLDTDIMPTGETYELNNSAAAIALAALIIDDGWIVTHNGSTA